METVNPEEIVYSVTVLDILRAIERRIGKEETLNLTVEEIQLAKEEVLAVLDHNLDIRDFVEEGIDAWEITRTL